MGENWQRKVKKEWPKYDDAPGHSWKNSLRRTSKKDSQKHLNVKTFRPTISHRRRERAGR